MTRKDYLRAVEEQIRCQKARPMVRKELEDHIQDQRDASVSESLSFRGGDDAGFLFERYAAGLYDRDCVDDRDFLCGLPLPGADYVLGRLAAWFGWSALVVVILFLAVFLGRMLRDVLVQKNRMGFLIGTGITGLFCLKTVLYMLENLGIMYSVFSVDMPFLSGKAHSVILHLALLGLLLAVYRNTMTAPESGGARRRLRFRVRDFPFLRLTFFCFFLIFLHFSVFCSEKVQPLERILDQETELSLSACGHAEKKFIPQGAFFIQGRNFGWEFPA